MNIIKNIHLIAPLLSDDQVEKLNAGAQLLKRHSSIEFKIISRDIKTVTIQAIQTKNQADIYLSQKEIISKTKDLFSSFIEGFKINVHAVAYEEHPISKLDEKWLAKMMLEHNVKAKDLVADTGIDKTNISAWLNGIRPMSQITKAMFYFYFKIKN